MHSLGRKRIIHDIKTTHILVVPHGRTSERQRGTQVHKSPPQEESKYCFAEVPCATACSQCSYKRTGSTCAIKPLAHCSLSREETKYLRERHALTWEETNYPQDQGDAPPRLFHMVGPASDNVAPKSTSPRHRRTANIVSPELPARQLAASVLQKARKQLLCKAACAQLALARGNEIFARVPCSHVRGNELSPISRRRIFSSFHLVGPASDNVAPKSTSPHHRRNANTVPPKLPARQLAASVPTRGQEVVAL